MIWINRTLIRRRTSNKFVKLLWILSFIVRFIVKFFGDIPEKLLSCMLMGGALLKLPSGKFVRIRETKRQSFCNTSDRLKI